MATGVMSSGGGDAGGEAKFRFLSEGLGPAETGEKSSRFRLAEQRRSHGKAPVRDSVDSLEDRPFSNNYIAIFRFYIKRRDGPRRVPPGAASLRCKITGSGAGCPSPTGAPA